MKLKFLFFSGILLSSSYSFSQVGINTTTPSAAFDIVSKGNTSATKALEVNNSSGLEMLTVKDHGLVGINTNNPLTQLHVKSSGQYGVLRVDNPLDGGFAGIYFYQDTAYKGHLGYVNTGTGPFYGGGTFQVAAGNRPLIFAATPGSESTKEVGRFDNNTGNFGINTTTPKSKLEVNGIIATGIQNITAGGLINKTYVAFSGGTAELPRAADNPGAIIFVKNTNSTGNLSVTVTGGGSEISYANGTSGAVASVSMDGTGTTGTKTILFISDGTGWTAIKFGI